MRAPCDETVVRAMGTGVPFERTRDTWILTATILGSSMAFLDSTLVNVALPAIQSSYHATVVDEQWVVESYGLLLGELIMAGGSLGDLFGRWRICLLVVTIISTASMVCDIA